MAALLMPVPRVLEVLDRHWLPGMAYKDWPDRHRYKVIVELSETFDVSRTLARLRVDDLFQKALPAIRISLDEGRSFASLAQCWPPTLFAHLRKAA
jgi:hypothetical protein